MGFRKNPYPETSIHGSDPEISLSEPENPGSERGERRIRSHESGIRSHERQNRTAGGSTAESRGISASPSERSGGRITIHLYSQ